MGGRVLGGFRNLYSEQLGYNKSNNPHFTILSSFYMLATLKSFMYITKSFNIYPSRRGIQDEKGLEALEPST